jgi:hypothetical protein
VEVDPGEGADEAQPGEKPNGEIAQEALDALAASISNHWMGGYEDLGSVSGVIGTAVLGVSAVEMVASTVVRMSVLYTWKGPGLWMMTAFWGTAFQLITMPSRWALEWGQARGEAVSRAMEARAAYVPGQTQEDGPGNVEVLADWAASWRRRVYGLAPSIEARVGGANLPIDGGGTSSKD